MRIGDVARHAGTTVHAIRWYERRGLVPLPARRGSYREYSPGEAERVRLLVGLRQLGLPLDQSAELAGMCAEGRCDQVSAELSQAIEQKRQEIARRIGELAFLDHRLAHLTGELASGERPRNLINSGKEERHAASL